MANAFRNMRPGRSPKPSVPRHRARTDNRVQPVASFQGCTEPLPCPVKVVGMGSAGVDYLAQVAAFPRPDDKLRTERLEVQGGGNAGNALTAAARLGLAPALVTKIGGDALGDGILAEFEREGVATGLVLRAPAAPSPFTYIIVDTQGGTRTCIHTPGEPLQPEELTPALAAAALDGAALVYFDGRLTEAALVLAAAAKEKRIPVLVEAERLRPRLEELLQLADYVITSAHFPAAWTGEDCLGDAVVSALARLPRVKWMVTTLGRRGCVLLEKADALAERASPALAEDLIERLFAQAADAARGDGGGEVVCVSAGGVRIAAGGVTTATAPHRLQLRRGTDVAAAAGVAAAAAAAAHSAAAANADACGAERYAGAATAVTAADAADAGAVTARVTVAQAARLPPDAVVDTTGAGDAFIGSMLYCLATGKPAGEALRLGAVVAACKCTALGARPGLPRRADLAAALL